MVKIISFSRYFSFLFALLLGWLPYAHAQTSSIKVAPGASKTFIVCTDEGPDVASCVCPTPGEAPANIFLKGLEYDTSYTTVCLPALGNYNSETGLKASANYDSTLRGYVLNGKYLRTGLSALAPSFNRFAPQTNDFRLVPSGTSGSDARGNGAFSAETHLYYYISNYRSLFANDAFFGALGLNPNVLSNLTNRQYRPDLQGIVNARLPISTVTESVNFSPWVNDNATNNISAPIKQRSQVSSPLDSFAFDPEWVVGQYAGVMSNWITAGTSQWPNNPTWGTVNSSYDWRTDIRPAIREGFKLWAAYRYSGKTEVYRYSMASFRRQTSSSCGTTSLYACDKGWNIDNAGMYLDTSDPVLNNPSNPSWPAANSDDTLLFPFKVRGGVPSNHGGPDVGGGLGGMYVAALFYDISKDIGLGDTNTDKLFWKVISLIDPGQAIDMTAFGQKIQQAARALWPVPGNPGASIYEQDIFDTLTSRGIRMNGATDFRNNLPNPIGVAGNQGPGTLTSPNATGVGSSIPESQRNSTTGYNFLSYFINTYNVTTPGTQYVTYQFYKFSKYGAADSLDLTSGTFNTTSTNNPLMNFDGAMATNYSGRSLGNMVLMAPGASLSFMRRRQSAVSERDGYYAEDVRPFGFRVIKATPNGFTFSVARTGENASTVTYQLTIVDPSLTMTGANTGPATYQWSFTAHDGTVKTESGQSVSYSAAKNQPFTLSVDRVRGAQTDNITLRERGNDLDRNAGKQFNQNYVNVGYPVGFDTIVNRRLVEGHGSYNSALNPVGGAFGVQGRRWTTPNQIVQPLTFSAVSHGLGSGSNQNGPYRFADAVYYNACIWGARDNVTNFPGCHNDLPNGDYEIQVPFSSVGITLSDPFAVVTAASLPGYLWTVNYPANWRLQANREYYFGGHISASVVNNGYAYNVCSYAQAPGTAGQASDRSDWLAGANWSGQSGAPVPQTMRSYLASAGSVSNCTFSAYRFTGVTVPQ